MNSIILFLAILTLNRAFVHPTTSGQAGYVITNKRCRVVSSSEINSGPWFQRVTTAKTSALENERFFRRTRFKSLVGGVSLLTVAYSVGAALSSSPASPLRLLLPAGIALSVAGLRAMPVLVRTPPLALGDNLEFRSALGPFGVDKGLGLFALCPLTKGTYLFDFEGEVLSEKELHDRYDQGGAVLVTTDYVSKLTGPWGVEDPIYVDARDPTRSNLARYMNHAPRGSPSCNVEHRRQRWSLGQPTATKGRAIRFFLSRDVEEGEELSCDYGDRY